MVDRDICHTAARMTKMLGQAKAVGLGVAYGAH
jgi:hypothetical protein